MTTDHDLAWLAGFIDGEGTFTLPVSHVGATSIMPRIQVANTNAANLSRVKDIVSEIVGREVRYYPVKRTAGLPVFLFSIQRQTEVIALCEAILPFLVGKKPQAELMLRFQAIRPGRGGDFDDRHHAMVQEMRTLNVRTNKHQWDQPPARDRTASPEVGEETVRTP